MFERLILKRNVWYIEGSNIRPHNIIEFRKNSKQHGLKSLYITIQNTFSHNKVVYVASLYGNAAYDRVSITKLLKLLQQFKLSHNYLIILWKLLKSRTTRVRFKSLHIVNS